MSNDKFDPMQAADHMADVAAAYGGLRNAIIQQGFTPEQAGDLVVATIQQAAAEAWKTARGVEQ